MPIGETAAWADRRADGPYIKYILCIRVTRVYREHIVVTYENNLGTKAENVRGINDAQHSVKESINLKYIQRGVDVWSKLLTTSFFKLFRKSKFNRPPRACMCEVRFVTR